VRGSTFPTTSEGILDKIAQYFDLTARMHERLETRPVCSAFYLPCTLLAKILDV